MTTMVAVISKISQEKLNAVIIFWMVVLTVILSWQFYWDYTTVSERNRKLAEIYQNYLVNQQIAKDQHARYEIILKAEEERLGIKNETNK